MEIVYPIFGSCVFVFECIYHYYISRFKSVTDGLDDTIDRGIIKS
jgi:hypothetical protein